MTTRRPALCAALLLAAACAPAAKQDGIDPEGKAFDKVAPEEVVTLTGTEPFWTLVIAKGEGVWTTPERQPGARFAVTRFAGNNGLGFSGTLEDKSLVATLTPGSCSDGMSDRSYPYVATVALDGETFEGCGFTSNAPFTGDTAP